jgi:signal transduction histidine kinase
MQKKINKQMEQLYIEKKREEELDAETKNFFNYATHEMKTPITAIKGYGELLEQGAVEENLKNKMYSRIVLEANRIDNLVRNMLVIARGREIIEQKSEEFNLKELIEEMTTESELLLEKEKVRIVLSLEDVIINAVKEEFRIAFKNLIENAIKYSLDKMVYIQTVDNNPYSIAIKNNCGLIPEKLREHLFEPFIKYNYGNIEKVSSGLGLFICKELLEKNNAKIYYEIGEENISFVVEMQEQVL